MKKIVIVLTIIVIILSLNKQEYKNQESIRFRVIANSNEIKDQTIKKQVVKNIANVIWKTQEFTSIKETRNYLKQELPTFDSILKETLEDNNYEGYYQINYGMNYFPEKKENHKTYPEGEYESLVITLGEGEGENFWCILFPPLCFMEEEEDVEYKSILKEWIEKYF